MREIERSKHFRLRYDEKAKLLVVERLDERWVSLAQIIAGFEHLERVADAHIRPGSVMFVDSRRITPRDDPEFEEVFGRCRRHFNRRFSKIAVLVKTAVGKLQVQRISASDGNAMRVFSDMEAALEYLGAPKETAAEIG